MSERGEKELRDARTKAALVALSAIYDELKRRLEVGPADETSLREALKKLSAQELLKQLNRTITAIKEPTNVRVQVGPSKLPAPRRNVVKDIEAQVLDPEKSKRLLERQKALLGGNDDADGKA